jgi:hypothetical protein
MTKAQFRVVDNEVEHPRDRARRLIAEWRSNAELEKLPTSNTHDGKGAAVLDVNAVLRKSEPDYAKK